MRYQWHGISFSSTGGLAAWLLLGFWGCCPGAHQMAQPPPPPPKPCPAVAAPETPAPPPPPKCESLDEKCEASADTRLAVGDNEASFVPPPGWLYAREPEQSIVVSPDSKGWLAFAQASSDSPKDLLATFDHLVGRLAVDKVRTNLLTDRIKRPQHELDGSGIVTKLWEIDKKSQFGTEPVREGAAGTLLLVVVPMQQDALVGAAFVTADMGDTYAKLVMAAVQTLAPLGHEPSAAGAPAAAADAAK